MANYYFCVQKWILFFYSLLSRFFNTLCSEKRKINRQKASLRVTRKGKGRGKGASSRRRNDSDSETDSTQTRRKKKARPGDTSSSSSDDEDHDDDDQGGSGVERDGAGDKGPPPPGGAAGSAPPAGDMHGFLNNMFLQPSTSGAKGKGKSSAKENEHRRPAKERRQEWRQGASLNWKVPSRGTRRCSVNMRDVLSGGAF